MRKYVILAVVTLICYFVQSFFQSSGGIGADSLSYFGIAADLPHPETALFPLGYPAVLRLFYEIFGDWFWASKVLNVSFLIIILVFSYVKKFYFRETVLLVAAKTVFFIFSVVLSESLFLFLCYFLVYLVHGRFYRRIRRNSFIFLAALMLVLLFSVRYSGIYIYAGVGFFWLIMLLNSKSRKFRNDLLRVLLLSGTGISLYLWWNYVSLGSLTGEDLRGRPAQFYPVYILRDILGLINIVDPYIGIKPASNSVFSLAFQIILAVADIFFAVWMFRMFKRKKALLHLDFHYFLWTVAVSYAVCLCVSGYFQQIEEMNVRMLAASNFILVFSFLIIYFADQKNDKLVFRIACFFLIFQTLYTLKVPGNYFEVRNQIEPQMSQYSQKEYLYNDEKDVVTVSTYQIPFINKELKYPHTAQQPGYVKQSVAGALNPKIKWLKYDTLQDKSKVLYTSEISLK